MPMAVRSTPLSSRRKRWAENRWRWSSFARRASNVGDGVEVLARRGDDPVLVRKGSVMAATFHPELSQDTRVHAEFLKLVKNGK